MARYDHVVLYDSTDEEAILMLTQKKRNYTLGPSCYFSSISTYGQYPPLVDFKTKT